MITINLECAWHTRELGRFSDGTYKRVPVSLDYPAAHFVHLVIAETEGDTVAYTPSPEHGERDRQVRLKFGRYLKKVWPEMADATVQSHVTALKSALSVAETKPELKFATDRDTISEIFETEMKAWGSDKVSCMHGKFIGTDRPYHVYANSPDVAVAYVVADSEIVARSVVSTKDKVWVRAYASANGDNDTDCGTLKAMLKDAGYSKGDLYGNRLTNLGADCLPYLDNGGAHVENRGAWWVVCKDGGDYECDCADGTATELKRTERGGGGVRTSAGDYSVRKTGGNYGLYFRGSLVEAGVFATRSTAEKHKRIAENERAARIAHQAVPLSGAKA